MTLGAVPLLLHVTYSDIIMFTCGVGLATPDNIAMLCMGMPILHYNVVTWTPRLGSFWTDVPFSCSGSSVLL